MPATAPFVEHHDAVGVHDRAHPLGHHEDRRVARLPSQGGAQPRVGREVQGREAVVEHVHLGAADQRARDGDPLPLPAGEVRAALVDRGVEPLGHGPDEIGGLRDRQGVPQLLVGGVGPADAQVAAHGAAEEEGPLGHQPDPRPEVVAGQRADVDAVDEDRARGHVEKPRHQRHQRGLARSGRPHDRRRLARRRQEGDASQHRLLGPRVAELHVAELDRPAAGGGLGGVGVGHRGDDVQDRADALGRCRGPRHHDEHHRRHHHRHQDLDDVREEGREVADRHLAGVDPLAAEPDHRDAGQVHDEHQAGHHQGEQPVDGQRGRREVGVRLGEPAAPRARCARTPG